MPAIKAFPLPIKFESVCLVTGRRTGMYNFATWWQKFNDYGAGHLYLHHREELITHYSHDPSALDGLWHMVVNMEPTKPFNKLQQTLLLSAFPNSAKKLILSMKCAGDLIEWVRTKPDEMLDAMEIIIPKATPSIREYRANSVLGAPSAIRKWLDTGALPAEWQKIKDDEAARRAALVGGGPTVAPETKPVPVPAVSATERLIDELAASLNSAATSTRVAYTAQATTSTNVTAS